jgi:hypothetical protein
MSCIPLADTFLHCTPQRTWWLGELKRILSLATRYGYGIERL